MTVAAVLGGAVTVWSELHALRAMARVDVLVAVNHAFRDYQGEVDHACSFHTSLFPQWIEQRRAAGLPDAKRYWSCAGHAKVKGLEISNVPAWGGSSGLVGAEVGLAVAERVVLCGVPLSPEGEHFDRPGLWREAKDHRHAWEAHAGELRPRVRSMGGWTAELLGRPDAAWLAHA